MSSVTDPKEESPKKPSEKDGEQKKKCCWLSEKATRLWKKIKTFVISLSKIFLLVLVPVAFLTVVICYVYPELSNMLCAADNGDNYCVLAIHVCFAGSVFFVLGSIVIYLWVRYDDVVLEKTSQRIDIVESLIGKATVAANKLDENDQQKKICAEKIKEEINRLRKEVGLEKCTYYQTLHLEQLLVDEFDHEQAQADAERTLTELGDYVADSSHPFDREQFEKWSKRLGIITNPKNSIEYWQLQQCPGSSDDTISSLQLGKERLKALMDYIAGIETDWATGSIILRNFKLGSIAAIIAFTLIALLPVICHWGSVCGRPEFGWVEWGLLGIVGALVSVLYEQQKSNVVDVGNTEGQREVWRVLAGGCLGLVAGLMAYALFKSGLIDSNITPYGNNVSSQSSSGLENDSLYLSFLWAISAGFGFEKIFERTKQTWGAGGGDS